MNDTQVRTSQLNVLLLGASREMWGDLHARLSADELQCIILPVTDYVLSLTGSANIGAAVIDMSGLNEGQLQIIQTVVSRLTRTGVSITVIGGSLDMANESNALVQLVTRPASEMLAGMVQANLANCRAQQIQAQTRITAESDLTEQLKMAGRVQREFLPAKLPDSAQYKWMTVFHPAEWVSGDIYDIARLDENHIGFYIADAVGHSMPAALLTMFLKHSIMMRETKGNTYQIFEPLEVISRLNILMAEQGLSGCQFATACYCLLNMSTREVRFCRAGHPYPMVIKASGEIVSLESRGPLLGVFKDSKFLQEKVVLEKGDKLLLYTDGAEAIIGQTDENGKFDLNPGFRKIARLPIEHMMTRFDMLAEDYESADGPTDDIAAVAVEIL
jgi:sigma-B regulation protein RsbU (phosphoserine phosphatase)